MRRDCFALLAMTVIVVSLAVASSARAIDTRFLSNNQTVTNQIVADGTAPVAFIFFPTPTVPATLIVPTCGFGAGGLEANNACTMTPVIPPGADTMLGAGVPAGSSDNSICFGSSDAGCSSLASSSQTFTQTFPVGVSDQTLSITTTNVLRSAFRLGTGACPGAETTPCRENVLTFSVDQAGADPVGDAGSFESAFLISFNINSITDGNGDLVVASGDFTRTIAGAGCPGFVSCGPVSGTFTATSAGEATVLTSTNLTDCPVGTVMTLFNNNGCR